MRVPRLSIPALSRSTLVNAGLAVLAVAGGVWAYFLVTANPNAAAAAATGGTRTVAVSQGEVTSTVSATGSIQSGNTASADFITSGTVTSISVHVGDAVKKGQVLAQVDPTDSQDQLNTANANLNAAQASLTRANAGGDPATIASAQAQVTDAQATVDADQRALTGTTLTAPMAGTVTAINGSVGGSSGGGSTGSGGSGGNGGGGNGGSGGGGGSNNSSSSSSSSSSGFIQLADLTQMQVTANFAEADATKLKTGQAANVSWAALTGATATGTVATIAPTATTSNNVNSYAVTVNLTTLPTGIRIGQTVTVVVTTADAQNAIRVPNAAVRTAGTRHTVTVMDGTTPQLVSVEVGVVGDTFTQITSGLTVGQEVVIVTTPSGTTNSNTGRGGFGGGGLGGAGGFGGGGLGGGGGFGGGGTGTTRTGTGTGGR